MDELSDEVHRLREELARLNEFRDHHRVLISATADRTIEVFADPKVKVRCICLPETKSPEEFDQAVESALRELPAEFRTMLDEMIKPELFSVRCLSHAEYQLVQIRLADAKYLNQLAESIKTIAQQQPEKPVEPW